MNPGPGGSLPRFEIISRNYGADHPNRIHSDEGAAQYGFAGALVPGVAIYAYLTRPVVDALGRAWLERGSMSAKFLNPVYDAHKVIIDGKVETPGVISLELVNSAGELCAVGGAGMPSELPKLDPAGYPELPEPDALRPATIDAMTVGEGFGSLELAVDLASMETGFLADMLDDSPIYRGVDAICHPAWWISKANEMIMRNVDLGPWIHTASRLQQYDLARNRERLTMRGRLVEAATKRGHEMITLDLAVFGEDDRPITSILHSAIIKIK